MVCVNNCLRISGTILLVIVVAFFFFFYGWHSVATSCMEGLFLQLWLFLECLPIHLCGTAVNCSEGDEHCRKVQVKTNTVLLYNEEPPDFCEGINCGNSVTAFLIHYQMWTVHSVVICLSYFSSLSVLGCS